MAINMTEFWDSNYNSNPPLNHEMIQQAEDELGLKLPDSFLALLKIQNGGYTKGFAFPMTEKTTWADNHVPLNELFGIVLDKKANSSQNIMLSGYMTKEWDLPDKQILLTGDGHWWITLDYRQGSIPTVRWIDSECGEDIHIANSFYDFYDGLVRADEYTKIID